MEDFLWVAALMLIAGSALALVSGLGILRLPDFYTRMNAAGISDTLCSALILLALIFHFGMTLASLKVVLILAFMLFTCPTASHALMRTARHNGLQPWLANAAPALATGSSLASAMPDQGHEQDGNIAETDSGAGQADEAQHELDSDLAEPESDTLADKSAEELQQSEDEQLSPESAQAPESEQAPEAEESPATGQSELPPKENK